MLRYSQDNFYNHCLTESARRDTELDAQRVRSALRIRTDPILSLKHLPSALFSLSLLLVLGHLITYTIITPYCTAGIPHTSPQGVFTGHARQSSTQVPTSLQQVKEYSAAFTEKVQMIVHQLGSHSDLDVRFLGVRLSFSDYYRSRREKEQRS